MAEYTLPLDIAVLYLAVGIPITVLGALVGVSLAIVTGVALIVAGLLFLLIALAIAWRHRAPRPSDEPWHARSAAADGSDKY